MCTIPEAPKAYDFNALVNEASQEIAYSLEKQSTKGSRYLCATIYTQNSAGGGYPMDVVRAVLKNYADRGWFCYLVQGGAYNSWSSAEVQNYESSEGYRSNKLYANYYSRVK